MTFLKMELQWWLCRGRDLAIIAAVIAVASTLVYCIHSLFTMVFDRMRTSEKDDVILLLSLTSFISLFVGVFARSIFDGREERRSVPECDQCVSSERGRRDAERAREDIENARKEIWLMMRNLVYNSQDDLDELLGILGARVQKVCNEETELAQKASQEKLSPVDALRREKLINEINRYRTFYQNIVRYARIFNLIVSERWSAYFPERNKAA